MEDPLKKVKTVFRRLEFHVVNPNYRKSYYHPGAGYRSTGLPVTIHSGNPKRYHSQDVVRMSGQSSVRRKNLSGPVEDIETEGQRQLKSMLEKQLNTSATIRETLARSRQFSEGTLYSPATNDVSGIVDLSDYKALERHDSHISELRLCGLTDEEIQIKLKAEGEILESKKPRLDYEPSVLQAKINEINKKIECHKKDLSKPDTFAGQTKVGRHAMDLERSLVKDNTDSKRLSSVLIKSETSLKFPHPDHPMNHIPEILEEVAGSKLFEKNRHRKGKREKQIQFNDCVYVDQDKLSENTSETIGCKNREDASGSDLEGPSKNTDSIAEKSMLGIHCTTNLNTSMQSPTNSTKNNISEWHFKKDKDQIDNSPHIKMFDSLVHQISDDEIIRNRLSVEEILKLPKFENYMPGTPNNVLYLKNLPHKVTENELGSLFLRFQDTNKPPVTFRIMSGKMRGQAFVTFNDLETAEKALKLINGYKLHDKPIIIQYGKR